MIDDFVLHYVWVGRELPFNSVLNLYHTASMFTEEQYSKGSFIPLLFLDSLEITSSAPIEIIDIDKCLLPYIQEAASKLGSRHILKIKLHDEEKYIPVILWENLVTSITIKLNSFITENKKLLEKTESFKFILAKQDFDKESVAKHFIEAVEYLRTIKAYVAASDIIRLLLLMTYPGCYSDIFDIELKALPFKTDKFRASLLLNREHIIRPENDKILSLNSDMMCVVLTELYAKTKRHFAEIAEQGDEWIDSYQRLTLKVNELLNKSISLFDNKIDIFYDKLISFIDEEHNFFKHHAITEEDKKIVDDFNSLQSHLVDNIAGFPYVTSAIGNIYDVFPDKYPYPLDVSKKGLEEVLQSNKIKSNNNSGRFSWNTPGLSFVTQMASLGILLTNKPPLFDMIKKEITDISTKYALNHSSVIEMALLAKEFLQNKPENRCAKELLIKTIKDLAIELSAKIFATKEIRPISPLFKKPRL